MLKWNENWKNMILNNAKLQDQLLFKTKFQQAH